MDELFKSLLENELLNEETRTALSAQFQTLIETTLAEEKVLVEQQVREEITQQLSEQWVTERQTLIETIDAKTDAILNEELTALKADIESFRNLELEFAGKLVEEKQILASQLKESIGQLATMLDQFVVETLESEMSELKEDLKESRKAELGKNIFEAFVEQYKEHFVNKTEVEKQLDETKNQVKQLTTVLKESEAKLAKSNRQLRLDSLLSNLSGSKREVMETILTTVPTEKLEEGYARFIDRVLTESKAPTVKESGVLTEGKNQQPVGRIVTGDAGVQTQLNEGVESEHASAIEKLRGLAGITSK